MFEYKPTDELLKGKIIMVTGAGDGIGRAAAKAYARLGATLILLGRTQSKLETVYDEIEAEGNPQPALVPLNLETAQEHDFMELASKIENEFGRLDGLLHNASIIGVRTPISSYDPAIWQQVMQINLNAPFVLTQILLPLIERSEQGTIIFTSSGVGRTGRAYWGAYSVSKFATEGLMQILADELINATNIRVNCINPGATRTKMRAGVYPAENPAELPTPEEIMPLYMYLMGKDSLHVNGQSLDAQQAEGIAKP